MKAVRNPHKGGGMLHPDAPMPSVDSGAVSALLALCPKAAATPLTDATELAGKAGVSAIWVKDERTRMGLGSFKALGAAYVIARDASAKAAVPGPDSLAGQTYVTASAGNHGMSVAAGARAFGADAVVYIAETVPEVFADRLREFGATVVREGADYAASIAAAMKAADDRGWILLSDGSWPGYTDLPFRVMEGYLQMAHEISEQTPEAPTHIVLQAGVGGLAGAAAAYARHVWKDGPTIIVVEPDAAPALQASVQAGHAVTAPGPDSIMGRLDCKDPSLIALNGLARDADWFVTLTDAEVLDTLPVMAAAGLETTASGGAGLAVVLHDAARAELGIGPEARVLCIVSEQPE